MHLSTHILCLRVVHAVLCRTLAAESVFCIQRVCLRCVPAAAACLLTPQMLRCVSRTSLSTKLAPHLVEQLTDIVTDAVLTIKQPEQPLDLYMVRAACSSCCCFVLRG